MSTDMETESVTSPVDDATALAGELGEAIAELPEYEAYEAARIAVTEDDDAQAKIREFEQRRREFATARQAGEATEADLEAVKDAQQSLHALSVMDDYLEAQAALDERLEAINEAISDPLTLDFGAQAGGCCED